MEWERYIFCIVGDARDLSSLPQHGLVAMASAVVALRDVKYNWHRSPFCFQLWSDVTGSVGGSAVLAREVAVVTYFVP